MLLLASQRPAAAAGDGGPLVLVVVDTLRADHLPCYGYGRPTAPAICGLARDGVLFEKAYTPRTATTPSIASMLTGLYPHRHGLRELYLLLPGEVTTVAEILHRKGYRTGAFVSSFVMVNDFSGFARGFEVYDEDVRTREALRDNYERPAQDTLDSALRWFAAAGPHAFLFVHLIEPHGPYAPPEPYLSRFALPAEGLRPGRIPDYQRLPGLQFVSQFVGRYDGEIAAADAGVGRLLAFLRTKKWYDRATIVFAADHGESMGEGGRWFEHGGSVNDVEARVPLIVKFAAGSGAAPGTRRADPVSLVDVFPTLLAAAGIDAPPSDAAADLQPVARGAPRRAAAPMSELHSGETLTLVGHGRDCTVRWMFAGLTRDLRLADPSLAASWPDHIVRSLRYPADASSDCEKALAAATGPLVADALTYRLPYAVANRTIMLAPGRKAAFMAARTRKSIPLTEGEREALRKLGYGN